MSPLWSSPTGSREVFARLIDRSPALSSESARSEALEGHIQWDLTGARSRVREFWSEKRGKTFRMAQRRWGSSSSGVPLATVLVNESFLNLEEQTRFSSSKAVESWLKELHRSLGIQQSRGGWFGQTYFLMGNSPRLSRTVMHSVCFENGRMLFGTSFTYLAPQFTSVVYETFLLQNAWTQFGVNSTRSARLDASLMNQFHKVFMGLLGVPQAFAAPPGAKLPVPIPQVIPNIKIPSSVPTDSAQGQSRVRIPGVNISLPGLSENYLRSIDSILVSSVNQKASDRIRQAGEEARRSIQEAGKTMDQSIDKAGQTATSVIQAGGNRVDQSISKTGALAEQLQAQLLTGAGQLVVQTGQVLDQTLDRAIDGAFSQLESKGASLAAQVAIASTVGAGLADGFLMVGTHAIHYFVEWISGIRDEKDFKKASDFLLQHSGMILAQRNRIRTILERMDQVGAMTPNRLDAYSKKLKTKAHFISKRGEAWEGALSKAAFAGDEELHERLFACRSEEAERGKLLASQSDLLDQTLSVLSQKAGNREDDPILPYLCDQIESELDRLLQMEMKTYEALHLYIRTQGKVAARHSDEALEFVQECTDSGADVLKDSIQTTLNAFDGSVYSKFDDCEIDLSEYAEDTLPSREDFEEKKKCEMRRDRLKQEFHEETLLERQSLVSVQEMIQTNPSSIQRACEEFGKLKASSMMRPLSQITKRYLCYSGKGDSGQSSCLFDEGGPAGEGGFAYFKNLKKLKNQKCDLQYNGEVSALEVGQIEVSTQSCKTLFNDRVRAGVERSDSVDEETVSRSEPETRGSRAVRTERAQKAKRSSRARSASPSKR